MYTHHHHHDPDAFGGPRRRYRDPFAGPRPRGGGRGGFGPEAGFGPGAAPFGPPFGPGGFGPGFGPGGFGRGRGGHRRAGRGDIRAVILLLLAERPRHGYELIREIAERTDGTWCPSPGAIYPALSLLQDEGLVTIEAEGGRRLASLSEAGRAYVAAHEEELGDPFADAAARTPHPARALRDAVGAVATAAVQVARDGDDDETARAVVVLEQARRDLYRILAGDRPAAGGESTPPAPDDPAPSDPAVA